jgi:hypothetical protein
MTDLTRANVRTLIKQFTGQENMLAIPRVFIKFTGDTNSALMLSQILYWSERTDNPDGWFYKSVREWEDETCLSRYQQQRALAVLKPLGVEVKKKRAKGAPTLHYRINDEVFSPAFLKFLENEETRKSDLRETDKSEMRETRKSPIPKTISKTTQETTIPQTPSGVASEPPLSVQVFGSPRKVKPTWYVTAPTLLYKAPSEKKARDYIAEHGGTLTNAPPDGSKPVLPLPDTPRPRDQVSDAIALGAYSKSKGTRWTGIIANGLITEQFGEVKPTEEQFKTFAAEILAMYADWPKRHPVGFNKPAKQETIWNALVEHRKAAINGSTANDDNKSLRVLLDQQNEKWSAAPDEYFRRRNMPPLR